MIGLKNSKVCYLSNIKVDSNSKDSDWAGRYSENTDFDYNRQQVGIWNYRYYSTSSRCYRCKQNWICKGITAAYKGAFSCRCILSNLKRKIGFHTTSIVRFSGVHSISYMKLRSRTRNTSCTRIFFSYTKLFEKNTKNAKNKKDPVQQAVLLNRVNLFFVYNKSGSTQFQWVLNRGGVQKNRTPIVSK